jgi:hypothetical protein
LACEEREPVSVAVAPALGLLLAVDALRYGWK